METKDKKTIEDFCKDVRLILQAEDRKLFEAMTTGDLAEFNKPVWKGLGMFSTTEPILKYLIYTKLIHKYRMWSEEVWGYENEETPKYLDLALGLEYTSLNDTPDTAIEMKWAGLKKNGDFNKASQNRLINDLNKLVRNNLKNKYFMQFMIAKKGILDGRSLIDLNTYVDNRKVKVIGEPIHHFFETDAGENKDKFEFHIILWKVAKRKEE